MSVLHSQCVYDIHVRDWMKENRKGFTSDREGPKFDARNYRRPVAKIIVTVSYPGCALVSSRDATAFFISGLLFFAIFGERFVPHVASSHP